MGEQIVHALEHSAYLIVILGGGSERSEWVSREIGAFLKTHTRDRVLTVLAEGNERDSMPDILKTQEFFTEEGKKTGRSKVFLQISGPIPEKPSEEH